MLKLAWSTLSTGRSTGIPVHCIIYYVIHNIYICNTLILGDSSVENDLKNQKKKFRQVKSNWKKDIELKPKKIYIWIVLNLHMTHIYMSNTQYVLHIVYSLDTYQILWQLYCLPWYLDTIHTHTQRVVTCVFGKIAR